MYLLFDIGGSSIRFAISKDGKSLEDRPVKVDTPQDFEKAIALFKEMGNKLSQGQPILAMAGSVAGAKNREKSKLIYSPHLQDWVDKPLKERLSDLFNCPVYLENDAALSGLGETVYGAGSKDEIVVYVTVSTGIGGVRIVHGKIDVNRMGFEPGHQIIDADGTLFMAKILPGTLENYASGTALMEMHGKRPSEITDPEVWEEEARILALGLHNMIMHWSPDIIILGGGVILTTELSIDRIRYHMGLLPQVFPNFPIRIEKAILGDSSGLYGALVHLQNMQAEQH
jgi:predicted NBD/HSP70 family sugar kinase